MKKGEVITVEGFDRKQVDCRLIEVRGDTAIVCSEQEWQKANREDREPECLGWPVASVKAKRKTGAHAG